MADAKQRSSDLLARARLLTRSGDRPAAIACLEKALEIDPRSVPARKRLGFLRAAAGELDRALSIWQGLVEEIPEEAHKRLARLHEKSGDPSAALPHWRALLDLPGDAATRRLAMARCLPQLVREYPRPGRVLQVDADGRRQFTSIQAAVDAASAPGEVRRVEIQIAPGRYRERVAIPHEAPPLSLRGMGEKPEEVIVESDLMSDDPLPEPIEGEPDRLRDFRAATLFVPSDDHIISNLTVVNSRVQLFDERGGQPAARVDGDRVTFYRVVFVNWGSDTLGCNWGRQIYHECRLEARARGTDFIYGTARAVFSRCRMMITESRLQLVAHARSGAKQLHDPIYAATIGRTAGPRERRTDGGFVFSRCRVDTGRATRAFFGRPYGHDGRIVVVRTRLGGGIRPEGWTDKGTPEHRQTVYFAEHDNHGPGADTGRRVDWAHQLDEEEAAEFRPSRYLRDPTGQVDPWLGYVLRLVRETG